MDLVSCYLEVASDRDPNRGDESQNNAGSVGLSMVTIVPDLLETDHSNPQSCERRIKKMAKKKKIVIIIMIMEIRKVSLFCRQHNPVYDRPTAKDLRTTVKRNPSVHSIREEKTMHNEVVTLNRKLTCYRPEG